ncbi:uncharacterized protein LOC129412124 [Boleophthalmus pectinirostris]|uniref:uncharacterized protein LOC129412124 n=1 Tax=Boleophthalmus pectinirostris TaxID=150288 RepID=UPI00242A9FC1|nr:uncharacterized protein LOC129412124 [Boleophthalmus pectinirostris]
MGGDPILFHFLFVVKEENMGRTSANRGNTWATEEIQALVDIWADEYINQQLSSTHKNIEIFAIFSKQMREKGFNRSPEQCRIKVKKLRQKYIQVRDKLKKTGSSGKEKDKFIWFDELDKILGTKPVVDPVDVVENDEREPMPVSLTASSDLTPPSDPDVDDVEDSGNTLDLSNVSEVQSTDTEEKDSGGGKLPIPGAQARKRKAKSNRDDEVVEYLAQTQKMLHDIQGAEQRRMDQEAASFEKLLKAQQEAEERRFQAMQVQQQATNQMMLQLLSTLVNSQQHHSSTVPAWNSTTWPMQPHHPSQAYQQPQPTVEQPVIHSYPPARQYPSTSYPTISSPHSSTSQQDIHSVSSILCDANTQLHPL